MKQPGRPMAPRSMSARVRPSVTIAAGNALAGAEFRLTLIEPPSAMDAALIELVNVELFTVQPARSMGCAMPVITVSRNCTASMR